MEYISGKVQRTYVYSTSVEAEWSLITAGRTIRSVGKYSLFRGLCEEGGSGNYMTS